LRRLRDDLGRWRVMDLVKKRNVEQNAKGGEYFEDASIMK
jgi:hypothetical protein